MNLNDLLLEGSSVDYKEALEIKKPRSWLKSVSAFANSFGGHIVFGVRDNPREVCGLVNPQEVISKITELIKARIDPTPRYQLHAFAEDNKICVDLEIQNGPAYPYYYRFEGCPPPPPSCGTSTPAPTLRRCAGARGNAVFLIYSY